MKTRTAVILVAGVGSRLRPLTDDRPKALMSVGEETILGRAVRLLAAYGVERLILATGYREDAVRGALAGSPLDVHYCANPEYERTQNAVSLALCRNAVETHAFFKLDGDVVFDPRVLERLDASRAELAVAVDAARGVDAEAMKVAADSEGRIQAFGKDLARERALGESIGIERVRGDAAPRLFDALDAALRAGKTNLYYEDIYSELIVAGRIAGEAVRVDDLAWTEVDTLEDLERARAIVAASG